MLLNSPVSIVVAAESPFAGFEVKSLFRRAATRTPFIVRVFRCGVVDRGTGWGLPIDNAGTAISPPPMRQRAAQLALDSLPMAETVDAAFSVVKMLVLDRCGNRLL